jgi:pimeloyl-ACP methyl ester carboxylesterase
VDFVDANGLRFAYLSEGSGPLVLLLHGFPDTPHTWDRVMNEVARLGFRAVAPFMRGYHPTAIPDDRKYDGDTLGRDVLALIEALGEKQAIVVGHDWGALATYAAASLGPERIRKMIAIGVPHPATVFPTPRMLWNVRHFFVLRRRRGADTVRANDYAYVDRLVRRWSPAWKDIPAAETARVKEAFAEPGCAEAACAYYAALRPRVPKSLRRPIAVPAAVFAGMHDNFSTRIYDKARRRFSASYEVVKVPGGHFPHRERPDEFLRELTRLLRATQPS